MYENKKRKRTINRDNTNHSFSPLFFFYVVYITNNNILIQIALEMSHFSSLVEFTAANNNISGELHHLATAAGSGAAGVLLPNLRTFDVRDNQFTGTTPCELTGDSSGKAVQFNTVFFIFGILGVPCCENKNCRFLR